MLSFPNAKINLGLHVINKREDSYHNIETIFYPVQLTDILELTERKKDAKTTEKVKFSVEGTKINGEQSDNLILRAYNLLDKDFDLPPIECVLYKKIPMGAGLGGGSSNAAFMLKLLNEKFVLNISTIKLEQYASQLGSDCAFFIRNKPMYVFGKGHELEPIRLNLVNYYIVMIYSGVHSSTALAYKNVTPRGQIIQQMSLKELVQTPIETWKDHVINDFEGAVFNEIPSLAFIKKDLYDLGAVYASMSGSGSCVYGLFQTQPSLPEKLKKITCFEGKLN